MSLSRVPGDDELYIGGIFTLRRRSALEDTGITHVVSVLRYDFKDFPDGHKFQHCSVQVDDVDDENLLGEFPRTNAFIASALAGGGKVFVHCAMGKSRSVTVALAYLLSTRRHLDLASALALIRETRPMAEPNDGFMQQLQLYADMGCPADMDAQPAYQRWLYQKDVELSLATGRAPDRLRFEDEEQQELQTGETVRRDVASASDKELRCRKCRRTLATGLYLIPHQTRASDPAPPLSPYEPISSLAPPVPNPAAAENLEGACTHHFIHPLSWMRPTLERAELAGRLECPNAKCGALVGRYAWQGLKCSCGKWVVPGFSLQAGRVDEVVKGKMGEAGVRMPPGMLRGDLPGKGNL